MTIKANEYFSKVASNWDQLRKGYFPEAIRDLAIQKAYLRPDMIVADIGGGTGFLSRGMADLVQEVHLVDGSSEMLSQAQKNLSDWVNIHYHHADGLLNSITGSQYGCCFSQYVPAPLRRSTRFYFRNGTDIKTEWTFDHYGYGHTHVYLVKRRNGRYLAWV